MLFGQRTVTSILPHADLLPCLPIGEADSLDPTSQVRGRAAGLPPAVMQLSAVSIAKRDTYRALFINAGFLGHASVFSLLENMGGEDSAIRSCHVNLSVNLSIGDRIIRRLLGVQMPSFLLGQAFNLDFARWRQEWNVGWLAARRIRRQERKAGRSDILHFHTQATAYASIARMKQTPSIVSIDCTQTLASREMYPAIRRVTYMPNIIHDGFVFRAATAIISTSKWAADDLADRYPGCAPKVRVLPYPVRVDLFDPSWIDEREFRARQCPDAPVRLLFMGGDFERKGGFDLLDAWHRGGFAGRAELRLATKLPRGVRLPPGVTLLSGIMPYSSNWRETWRETDLFVMPTRHEAFGMVFQEAAGAGVPCIATNISAIPEIVADGVTGRLVPPSSPEHLCAAIDELIGDPVLRRDMGVAARKRAETLWQPARYIETLSSLMLDLARGRRAVATP